MNAQQLKQAQQQFYSRFVERCGLAITLQTQLQTLNTPKWQREWMATEARTAMHKFKRRLNQLLTGNGHRTKAEFQPIIVTALHGTDNSYDRNRTLHWHIAVGNYCEDRVMRVGFEDQLVRHWIGTGIGTKDVLIERIHTGARWAGYMNRETLQADIGSIDLETTQIPTHLLGN